ncbi:hypothetical protein MINTM020_01050 [Mycobacterium paraintracellulare]|nr:hypothetical protein MINTM020_01050 [Mycobacterium paraintracellulare]
MLRLDEHASRYVRQLAGKPTHAPSGSNSAVDPAVDSLLADLLPAPACAVTEAYDLRSWNAALAKVIGDPATIPPEQRNLVRMCFGNMSFRRSVSGWSAIAKSAVAEIRVDSALHPHNERLWQLIGELQESNHDFRLAWDALNVRPFFGEVATIDVAGVGSITVKVMELVLRDKSPITIYLFQPVDAESRRLLVQLVGSEGRASG